jgi:hypothetical protein
MADDQTSNAPANTSGDAAANARKPFEPPRVTVYGDIATLTRTVGRTGVADNGHGNNIRTSP